ncbi:YhdH/YhfP family quinone oxidoreductase [Allorhodopirellula solitaria]|uniref:Putative acrylyl-CoA reductase AcuI n=1 Tax=Allorhodopirellula solitaria TaxID=2527987 RepID=A0A5C5XSY2_9BACT|nr:YhdH/YhfP family quinone oxidoreductase [Allorhodopirellula solitaria]TWT66010.1 putative acrylyl-CoA reductase AcuI [Allorhodopirellula solitaria]
MNSHFRCFYVTRADDVVSHRITERPVSELPDGDVTIAVQWSSLNYKDALAATGNPGVAPNLPHVPGIDAAGVVEVGTERLPVGTKVIVTGYDLGGKHWGGWAERIRVPESWVVPLPDSLSLRETMIIGTAGFTAAQCVREIIRNEVPTDKKPILVTGATGGVGSLAVKLLSQLGYRVTAMTGKQEAHDWLRSLGASEIVMRAELDTESTRPMLSTRFQAGVDTVGGNTLVSLLKSVDVNGCVSACGMVGGSELEMTVFPFILRGVRLAGITSALCPMDERLKIWERLAGPWKLNDLGVFASEIGLDDLSPKIDEILAGKVRGRVVVNVAGV